MDRGNLKAERYVDDIKQKIYCLSNISLAIHSNLLVHDDDRQQTAAVIYLYVSKR